MEDNTREVALAMQEGVRSSKRWSWGIFHFAVTESRSVHSKTFQVVIGHHALMLAITSWAEQ